MHEIFYTVNTSMHISLTSDYKRSAQNEEPHISLSLDVACYSLQTTGSWLLWAARFMMTLRNS